MKKSRKHIAFSALLAILVLSAQTVFFPLHYYLTHHNSPYHAFVQHEGGSSVALIKAEHSPSKAVGDEGCYWCDMFAHQGYFVEKFSEFIFISPEAANQTPLSLAYTFLETDLTFSRGPPAIQVS